MQLAKMRQQLHISYNQIWTYLECSLKYQFQYVERRDSERVSLNLFFGSAIHACLERYYNKIKLTGEPEDISVLQHLFAEHLTSNVFIQDVPVIYKKDLPDLDCAVDMGCKLLEAFYKSVDLTGMEIMGVELPLSASITEDIRQI